MIQSRASFIAVGLIFVFFIVLNFCFIIEMNKNLTLNLYLVLPLIFAVLVNQNFYSDKGADALSRAATISLSTN